MPKKSSTSSNLRLKKITKVLIISYVVLVVGFQTIVTLMYNSTVPQANYSATELFSFWLEYILVFLYAPIGGVLYVLVSALGKNTTQLVTISGLSVFLLWFYFRYKKQKGKKNWITLYIGYYLTSALFVLLAYLIYSFI